MEPEKHYRHELKYAVSHADYLALRCRLRSVMTTDPHVNADGRYQIRSIYFDNSDDKALREKVDGIKGQLNGSIPSTDDGQRKDASALVDASQIDVRAMGQFSMGGFGGQRETTDAQSGSAGTTPADRPDSGDMPDGESPPASDEPTAEDASGETPTAGIHRQRPSFDGMPERSANGTKTKTQNLLLFGVCFAVVLAALILAKLCKRR